jgi:penicillin G amidase
MRTGTSTVVAACAAAAVLTGSRGHPATQGKPATLETLAIRALAPIDGERRVPGVREEVRVVRDTWGVPHIYAESDDDLFFAQGYVMAQDRLWQMEMWRRAAEGRLAEILGPSALPRDRRARLLRFRGPFDEKEWTSYHPDARRLFASYAAGVNAFIDEAGKEGLPIEFTVTGITPERWTAETLVLRQVAFGDATSEIQLAQSVAELGAQEANRRRNPDPWDPLEIPEGLDIRAVGEAANALQSAMRAGGGGIRPDVLPQYRGLLKSSATQGDESIREPGSNNWVVSGALSATGKPVVVNDPHREVALPSLRYIVHLSAPGWNVIGASEPPFVGVAIGHNARLAWGLTIVGTDQHDVYVEELDPENHSRVKWNGGWEPIRIVREEIKVKGQAPHAIELKFTRHGPIFYEDARRHRAYALRSALHEPGTAPYLAGLRLAGAKNCRDFLDAARSWNAPSENLICGDIDGNIAWQASALTPARTGWSGRLPVPGAGRYEWKGFRSDLPREYNPERGFIATANHNVQPKGYTPPLMFKNADTRFDRITRLLQLITPGRKYTLEDHQRMQNDAYSLRAAADIPAFRGWTSADPEVERARAMLEAWDGVYRKDSAEAAIYETIRRAAGSTAFADGTRDERASRLEEALRKAIDALEQSQGTEWKALRWGRMHTREFTHAFIPNFNLATVERPGGAGTVAADGASYREILAVGDWDRSLVTNVPGQSAQPASPYYGNLLPLWAENTYFTLAFSDDAVQRHAKHTLVLKP